MSALGQKQTLPHVRVMSALLPKADIAKPGNDVRYVPKADIGTPVGSLVSAHSSSPATAKTARA